MSTTSTASDLPPPARERPATPLQRPATPLQRPANTGADRQGRASQPAEPASRLPVSAVALIASVGVLVASAAYTAGRLGYSGSPWAVRAYWLGQALILLPVAGRLLSRHPPRDGAVAALIVILTVAEYLLKVCYSPQGFTFADELLHWRGTTNLLQTGQLFGVNYAIPIASHYPGLEEVTAAFIAATGMPLFAAGLIVAGVAHLTFICLFFLSFRAFTQSHRIGGVAVLIYFATPGLTSFNSMFVYETLALTFLALVVFAAWNSASQPARSDRARWFALAVLGIAATTITHHVTSYMLAIMLFLVTVTGLAARAWRTAVTLGLLAVVAAAMVAAWVHFIAPATISYFKPTVEGIAQGVNALQGNGSANAPPTSRSPLGDQALEGIGILIILGLLPFGAWQAWRHYRRNPWVLAAAAGAAGWFVALALRVGTPDGQELAGRTATYVFIPVSVTAALALIKLVNSGLMRRLKTLAIVSTLAVVVTLLFDGLSNGWPPYWERLPGPHQVAGFERSIGPQEIATADWTLTALGPGNRFATDVGTSPALAGYGNQIVVNGVDYLYTSPAYTAAVARAARAQAVRYVLVDWRLSQSLPPSAGTYFPGSSVSYSHVIPAADLAKFARLPTIARVYDCGNIVIYDLDPLPHAP